MSIPTSHNEQTYPALFVFTLLIKESQILLIKKNNINGIDTLFGLPTRTINKGEILKQTAIREVQEEVNVLIQRVDLKFIYFTHIISQQKEWIGVYFMTRLWEGEPIIYNTHKYTQMKWVNMNQLPEDVDIYTKQAIKAYQDRVYYSEM